MEIEKYPDFIKKLGEDKIIIKKQIYKNIFLCRIKDNYFQDASEGFKFLIANKEGKIVALVEECGNYDLVLHTLKRYRRKGFMGNALRDCILPFIFSGIFLEDREQQEISIDEIRNESWDGINIQDAYSLNEPMLHLAQKLQFKEYSGRKNIFIIKKGDIEKRKINKIKENINKFDNYIFVRNKVETHIINGNYFKWLADNLNLIRQNICDRDYMEANIKLLSELEKDLMYLQKEYKIVK